MFSSSKHAYSEKSSDSGACVCVFRVCFECVLIQNGFHARLNRTRFTSPCKCIDAVLQKRSLTVTTTGTRRSRPTPAARRSRNPLLLRRVTFQLLHLFHTVCKPQPTSVGTFYVTETCLLGRHAHLHVARVLVGTRWAGLSISGTSWDFSRVYRERCEKKKAKTSSRRRLVRGEKPDWVDRKVMEAEIWTMMNRKASLKA